LWNNSPEAFTDRICSKPQKSGSGKFANCEKSVRGAMRKWIYLYQTKGPTTVPKEIFLSLILSM